MNTLYLGGVLAPTLRGQQPARPAKIILDVDMMKTLVVGVQIEHVLCK